MVPTAKNPITTFSVAENFNEHNQTNSIYSPASPKLDSSDFVSPLETERIRYNNKLIREINENETLAHTYLAEYDSIVRLWIACAHHDFKIYFPARLELARLAHDTSYFGYGDGTITKTILRLLHSYFDSQTNNIILNPKIKNTIKVTAKGIRELSNNKQLQELAQKDGGEYIFQDYKKSLYEASSAHPLFNDLYQEELRKLGKTGKSNFDFLKRAFCDKDYALEHANYWNSHNAALYTIYQEAIKGNFDYAHNYINSIKGRLKTQTNHILYHLIRVFQHLHCAQAQTTGHEALSARQISLNNPPELNTSIPISYNECFEKEQPNIVDTPCAIGHGICTEETEEQEECKHCLCEVGSIFTYATDVARFNAHSKVQELGLKLTPQVAHHVMHGHVDRKAQKITGCHHCNNPCLRITKTKTFECGVSIARVKCGPYEKKVTSLFPDSWTHSKIIDVILESFTRNTFSIEQENTLVKYIISTDFNFNIELQLKSGYVDSYYPQINGLLNKKVN